MSSIALLLLAVMVTLGALSAKKRMCGICEYCSYICEYCRKPCCTPCSDYDPDFKEDTDFPKGRNGGVRNHPECLVKAKTQKQMDEELNRLKNLEITVQEIIEKSKTIAAHHNLILRHGVPNLGKEGFLLQSLIRTQDLLMNSYWIRIRALALIQTKVIP